MSAVLPRAETTPELMNGRALSRVVIMGAAGRDFHVFNVVYRTDPNVEVVAFTAAQIPGIANRRYPTELAGDRYPNGIPIVPEPELETVLKQQHVDTVVFAYSDVSHETVMHAASRVLAAGADFTLLGPDRTMLSSRRPVIAICATRTGAGKSQTSRRVAAIVAELGHRPVVVRHPMPYGNLLRERVQRFAAYDDLAREGVTIEEREEYEPHIDAGRTVYAGVDYADILRAAEEEGDVIIWDGGNNDLPFYPHDLLIAVTDPLRLGDETRYHPGEAVLRRADLVIINKVDTASREAVDALREVVSAVNPGAPIIEAGSDVRVRARSVAGASSWSRMVRPSPTAGCGSAPASSRPVDAERCRSTRARTRSDRSATRSPGTPISMPWFPQWATTRTRWPTSRRRSRPRPPISSWPRRRSTLAGCWE